MRLCGVATQLLRVENASPVVDGEWFTPGTLRTLVVYVHYDGQPVGGSIPMYPFMETLDASVIVLPIANHDNNQTAANENIRLQNLWDGIELYPGVMARLGQKWK